MSKLRVYLAGPMRGYKDFNFPAFHLYAANLRANGYEVFSPAERDIEVYGEGIEKSETGNQEDIIPKGFNLRFSLGEDLAFICAQADIIAMMPGWEHSAGARAEHATAMALKLGVIYL